MVLSRSRRRRPPVVCFLRGFVTAVFFRLFLWVVQPQKKLEPFFRRPAGERASLQAKRTHDLTPHSMPALLYNPDHEQVSFILRWNHTLLPMVVYDPMFWLLVVWYIVLVVRQNILLRAGEDGLPVLDWKAALVPTSLLTFFVVFYVSNCYERFFKLFGCCVRIGGCMQEWAYLINTHFGDISADCKWNMMRFMLGAMQIHYAFVAGEDDDDTGAKTITDEEWAKVRRRRFLSEEEVDKLISCTHGTRFLMPAGWALAEVKACLLDKLKQQQGVLTVTVHHASNQACRTRESTGPSSRIITRRLPYTRGWRARPPHCTRKHSSAAAARWLFAAAVHGRGVAVAVSLSPICLCALSSSSPRSSFWGDPFASLAPL